jgi:hypothetical protein
LSYWNYCSHIHYFKDLLRNKLLTAEKVSRYESVAQYSCKEQLPPFLFPEFVQTPFVDLILFTIALKWEFISLIQKISTGLLHVSVRHDSHTIPLRKVVISRYNNFRSDDGRLEKVWYYFVQDFLGYSHPCLSTELLWPDSFAPNHEQMQHRFNSFTYP